MYVHILLLFVYFQLKYIYTHTHTLTYLCMRPKTYAPLLVYFFFVFRFFFCFCHFFASPVGPPNAGAYIYQCVRVCVCIPSLSTHTLIDAAPTVVVVVAVAACCQRQNATSKIKKIIRVSNKLVSRLISPHP